MGRLTDFWRGQIRADVPKGDCRVGPIGRSSWSRETRRATVRNLPPAAESVLGASPRFRGSRTILSRVSSSTRRKGTAGRESYSALSSPREPKKPTPLAELIDNSLNTSPVPPCRPKLILDAFEPFTNAGLAEKDAQDRGVDDRDESDRQSCL